jgi:hypothetical protein|tara:strand:- start:504 stop:677 length:174 start_codon:yes stop_codon:yes gene_type:complete
MKEIPLSKDDEIKPTPSFLPGRSLKQSTCNYCKKDIDNGEKRLNCAADYKDKNGKTV